MADVSLSRIHPQAAAGDWLCTLPPSSRFILQGELLARIAVAGVLGVPLSETACRANANERYVTLWLGPDEHLIFGPGNETTALGARLEAALAGTAHSLVDISHRQISLQVCGAHADDILASGCPLDLDASAFPVGMCTRTLLGKADIVLWRRAANEFQVEVWRSFADYVAQCLQEAAQDFAAPA